MQAIHNMMHTTAMMMTLFQRAKIQDKCKQFTTCPCSPRQCRGCFKEQRYKINASNSQHSSSPHRVSPCCFKEQRYKINASNSQLNCFTMYFVPSCFKEQRYKINASNSQLQNEQLSKIARCFKEQRYKINASNSQQKTRL